MIHQVLFDEHRINTELLEISFLLFSQFLFQVGAILFEAAGQKKGRERQQQTQEKKAAATKTFADIKFEPGTKKVIVVVLIVAVVSVPACP